MRNTSRRMKIIAIALSLVMVAAMLGSVPVFAANDEQLEPAAALPRVSDELEQAFYLTIRTTENNTTFQIPTSRSLNSTDDAKPYNWAIDWGDGATETRSGTSSLGGGIPHTYALAGVYTIAITPNGSLEAWLGAFGFGSIYDISADSNSQSNKNLLIGAPSQITPQMTRTNAQIEGSEPAPNNEWEYTFSNCSNLVAAPVFAGWESISTVGDSFAKGLLFGCQNLAYLPNDFNLPQGLIEVGDSFASGMFHWCLSLTNLPAGFNLPQGLTEVGDYFASGMLYNCSRLTNLPAGFNLPQGLSKVGNSFASGMLSWCLGLTNLPAGFNLPQGLIEVGDSFANGMFSTCQNLTLLPAGFNLPQGLTEVGNRFAAHMLDDCQHLTNLPASFNLPQGLTEVGDDFAYGMFFWCFSLTNLPAGFNLPQGLTEVGLYFAGRMFYGAGSSVFQINDEFRFPASIPADTADAFYQAFNLSDRAPVQNRSAASIIGECPVPADQRETFDSHFADIDYIAVNWGGGGQVKLIPGSGDLNGDGVVTMEEVVVALQASVAAVGLTPEQLAVIDMDFDGAITLTDVILMLQKTV